MRFLKIGLISAISLLSLNSAASERWYNMTIVENGNGLFQQNCAVCHGSNAEGNSDWKKRMPTATIRPHH